MFQVGLAAVAVEPHGAHARLLGALHVEQHIVAHVHGILRRHAELAACAASLRRLIREYVRTERRARALENVVLPEIDGSLRFIEEQLDAVDQEEAVRVRNAAKAA